jgi:MFS family permease
MTLVSREAKARLDADPERVLEAARSALGAVDAPDGSLVAELPGAIGDGMTLRLKVAPDEQGCVAAMTATAESDIPYFGFAVRPMIRAAMGRGLDAAAAAIRASLDGDQPPPVKRFPLAPPVAFTAEQASTLATVCMAVAIVAFGSSLASQNLHFVARGFGSNDRALGVALAASRVGVLIGLVASVLSDRRGRRSLLLLSVGGVCAGTAVSAIAPNLPFFAAGQVLVRGFSNSAFAVAGIIAIEEAPEGARAYTISILSLAGGLGYAPGLWLLPLGDRGAQTWRVSFGLAAACALFLPGLAKRLIETGRYVALAGQETRRGSVREVVGRFYGGRFGVLVLASFLGSIFGAPGAQFQNRYLAEIRGFSGLGISVFIAVTGVPGFFGLLLGGRLAEAHGRRPVAVAGLLLTTVLQMLFFVTAGPPLWVVSCLSSIGGGMLTPVLGALGIELFATEIRGTANGLLIVSGVAGAALGLLVTGLIAGVVGGLGNAIALTGVAALAVVPLIPRLPEAAWRTLDEISPSQGVEGGVAP